MAEYVGAYRGFEIQHDKSGYTAEQGSIGLGYCDTLEEIKIEIDIYLDETDEE